MASNGREVWVTYPLSSHEPEEHPRTAWVRMFNQSAVAQGFIVNIAESIVLAPKIEGPQPFFRYQVIDFPPNEGGNVSLVVSHTYGEWPDDIDPITGETKEPYRIRLVGQTKSGRRAHWEGVAAPPGSVLGARNRIASTIIAMASDVEPDPSPRSRAGEVAKSGIYRSPRGTSRGPRSSTSTFSAGMSMHPTRASRRRTSSANGSPIERRRATAACSRGSTSTTSRSRWRTSGPMADRCSSNRLPTDPIDGSRRSRIPQGTSSASCSRAAADLGRGTCQKATR